MRFHSSPFFWRGGFWTSSLSNRTGYTAGCLNSYCILRISDSLTRIRPPCGRRRLYSGFYWRDVIFVQRRSSLTRIWPPCGRRRLYSSFYQRDIIFEQRGSSLTRIRPPCGRRRYQRQYKQLGFDWLTMCAEPLRPSKPLQASVLCQCVYLNKHACCAEGVT